MDQQLQGEGLGAGEEGEEGGQAVAQLHQGDDPSTATQLRWGSVELDTNLRED